jgi:hypothetical protein
MKESKTAVLLRSCAITVRIAGVLFIGLLVVALGRLPLDPLLSIQRANELQSNAARIADLDNASASDEVRTVATWIVDTADATGSPFVIVDKRDARIYVFDSTAQLQASAPVLLGGAHGDGSVPGIGERQIADISPEERTTPAGRFLGERGHNARGEDVVWVDYDAGVSMHRVITSNPSERRLERLATPTSDDNRISYGCINVPVHFYETHIDPILPGNGPWYMCCQKFGR